MSRHSVPCVLLPCDSEALQVPQQRSNPSSARAHTRAHSHAFAEDGALIARLHVRARVGLSALPGEAHCITLSKLCTHDLVSKSARHRRPSRSRSVIVASRACTPAVGRRTACAAREQSIHCGAGRAGKLGSAARAAMRRGARHGGTPDRWRAGLRFLRTLRSLGRQALQLMRTPRSRAPMAPNEELRLRGACVRSAVQCSAVGTTLADLEAAKHAAAKP